MDWRDEGVLLAVRGHGESAAIIEVFTAAHGRHAGVVRGGGSRRVAPSLQPGAQLSVAWRARLDTHLGAFTVEPLRSRAGAVMGDRRALAGLNAVAALLAFALPEREPHSELYEVSLALFDGLGRPGWESDYLRWELRLLEELGFGLDLESCAVTGAREGLAFVSPRTGRAVTAAAAGDWAERLLPLPPGLADAEGPLAPADLAAGLRLTGHFLEHLAAELAHRPLPEARRRLVAALERDAG